MSADRKVVPLVQPAPPVDGLETNEYLMPGILRGNKDIESSSVSIEFPQLTDEQINAGDECEERR